MLYTDGITEAENADSVSFGEEGVVTAVRATLGTSFVLQRCATQQGNLIDGMLWFVGDFDGDGRDDLADRWDDAGKFSVDVFVAQLTRFVYLPLMMR